VPLFNDRLEKEIDEWLYVMKYDDIPRPFRSKYMEQVAEKLSFLKMSPAEKEAYYYYLKKMYTDKDELQAAQARGNIEGKAEGRTEEKLDIAKKLLDRQMDIPNISAITGLSIKEIEQLTKE
jgi:predicted transposase/invertase (TIGR01784 family)